MACRKLAQPDFRPKPGDCIADLDAIPFYRRRICLRSRCWRSRRDQPDRAATSNIGSAAELGAGKTGDIDQNRSVSTRNPADQTSGRPWAIPSLTFHGGPVELTTRPDTPKSRGWPLCRRHPCAGQQHFRHQSSWRNVRPASRRNDGTRVDHRPRPPRRRRHRPCAPRRRRGRH